MDPIIADEFTAEERS